MYLFSHFKCRIQQHGVHSQCCTTTTVTNSKTKQNETKRADKENTKKGGRGGQNGWRCQEVQTTSDKTSQSRGCDVHCGDHSP